LLCALDSPLRFIISIFIELLEYPVQPHQVITALAALAQEYRLAVFRLLVQAGPEGQAAGVLAEAVGVSPSAMSFHLAQLSHAGLIAQRREGRSLIYSANYAAMTGLLGYLTENCCAGNACGVPEPATTTERSFA
jgi:ArsR family transcriptional regulator, arsenate/arsenite/antimonite-responsive transcriptional repressor